LAMLTSIDTLGDGWNQLRSGLLSYATLSDHSAHLKHT
jgi:hypothetical protein